MSFTVQRGTNISQWLSQSNRRGRERREWFAQADVGRIAELGFDHIRLPIDEEQMWDESGRREQEAFDLMDAAIDWCRAAGLKVVVDLHILRSHYFMMKEQPPLYADPAEAEKFGRLWADLSERMQARPLELVAYELMNEPVAHKCEDWNRVYKFPFAAIRKREPRRTIVLGSNTWQIPDTFDALEVPDDRNLILSFHFYYPMLITHYRAGWVDSGKYDGAVSYPGQPIAQADFDALSDEMKKLLAPLNAPYDAAAMERQIAKPLAVRAGTGLRLYCGEFGCIHFAPRESRLAWYRDFVSVMARHDIAWANWDYKGGFGLFTADGQDAGIAPTLLS